MPVQTGIALLMFTSEEKIQHLINHGKTNSAENIVVFFCLYYTSIVAKFIFFLDVIGLTLGNIVFIG